MGAHYQDGKYAFFVSVFKVTWSHNEPSESQTKNAQLTKESNYIALFLLQVGSIYQNQQLMICEKVNKIL